MALTIHSSLIGACESLPIGIEKRLGNIPSDKVCGVVFCGTADGVEYHDLLNEIKQSVYASLGKRVPVTLIPQELLSEGGFSVEVFTLEGDAKIEIKEHNGVCYGILKGDDE